MPEEKKNQTPEAEQPQEQASAPRVSKKMIFFGLIGFGAFVILIGVFSIFMGIFSGPPESEKTATTDAVVADTAAGHETDTVKDVSDLDRLEKEVFGGEEISGAADIDDVMNRASEEAATSDSIEGTAWLETEKAKLARERKDLETLKADLDAQQYRLMQLINKVNQIESARMSSLAKLYDGMKPTQVAPLISKLTDEQAVDVLLKMKPVNAAKILGALSPDRAARISAKMITLTKE